MSMPSLRQQAYDRILAMIENAELPRGAVSSEVALAQKLDMSRTPVRAALQQLELEGYVRIVSKHGVLILDLSSQRVGDLLEIIASLAMFSVSVVHASKANELKDISTGMMERFQSLKSAIPLDCSALIAFEYDLIKNLISLCSNNEMSKSYQNSASRLFWNQNDRRWLAPYSYQTIEQVENLIRSIGLEFETYRHALFEYLRTLKMTWK